MNSIYEDIKEGEKKQISKTMRDIDGVKYTEYTYLTKLKGGKIHKQIVKTKYVGKKKNIVKTSEEKENSEENTTLPSATLQSTTLGVGVGAKEQNEEKQMNKEEERQATIQKFVNEYKYQMLISLQNLLKTQFNENRIIEEKIILYNV